MKYIKQISVITILVALLGCASNRATYNTLAGTKTVVDESVTGYFTLVAKKQVSMKGVPDVARAYDTFEIVFGTAVSMAMFNTNAPATTPVLAAANNVAVSIAAAKTIK